MRRAVARWPGLRATDIVSDRLDYLHALSRARRHSTESDELCWVERLALEALGQAWHRLECSIRVGLHYTRCDRPAPDGTPCDRCWECDMAGVYDISRRERLTPEHAVTVGIRRLAVSP